MDKLKEDLKVVHDDYLTTNAKHDQLNDKYNVLTTKIRVKKDALEAHNEMMLMIEEHIKLNESLRKDCQPYEAASMDVHREGLQKKLSTLKDTRLEVEKDLKEARNEVRNIERELNHLNPLLSQLHKKRESIRFALLRRGVSKNSLSALMQKLSEYPDREGIIHESSCGDYITPAIGPISDNNYVSVRPTVSRDESLAQPPPKESWLVSPCTRKEAEELLKGKVNGTFLIRPSGTSFALSICMDSEIHHCRIQQNNGSFGFADPFIVHPSLERLVVHYQENSLEKHNNILKTCLSHPVRL